MESVVQDLADQQAELTALLEVLDDRGWACASPCEGWSVADVVLHLAQTNEMAIGSATGRFAEVLDDLTEGLPPGGDVDDGAALMVENQRGRSNAEVLARWREGASRLVDVLRAADPHERVEWVAGTLSVHTLATTRLAETWIHTGDVQRALGSEVGASRRLRPIARLAWRTLPYAFARAGRPSPGPVAFELRGPDGSAWDFTPDEPAVTVVRGDALELCLVAARRIDPRDTALSTEGPDGADVLELVRTYA
jgi:uncharacterized protein (TIGR03084 family)